MERPRKWTAWMVSGGLGLCLLGGLGCRGRDVRVPPVPRYSNEPGAGPGPTPRVGEGADMYGGLNPYADANLGSLPTVTEASPYDGISATPPAVAEPHGQSPVATPPPSASFPPTPAPDLPPMMR